MHTRNYRIVIALLLLSIVSACSPNREQSSITPCLDDSCPDTNLALEGKQYLRFADFDTETSGIAGILPANEDLHPEYHDLSDSERRGLAGWHLLSNDGRFSHRVVVASHGNVNVIKLLDSRERDRRFADYGLFNDPGCRANTEADAFGLVLDDCDDPYASGIIGVRLKPNPAFDPVAWNAVDGVVGIFGDTARKYDIPGEADKRHAWEIEPPYLKKKYPISFLLH